jgi:sec-independent protein translocase protein TatA
MHFSLTQLLVILVIVVLLFGTKRLGNIGSDLGNAIKGFKKSMKDEGEEEDAKQLTQNQQAPIDSTAQVKKEETKV